MKQPTNYPADMRLTRGRILREVLECASPLALWRRGFKAEKRQGACAVQDASAFAVRRLPLRAVGFAIVVFLATVFSVRAQDSGAVSGVVVNSFDGAALSGATVTVRGTTLATQTDSAGRFELKGLPLGDQVLRFSKSGFAAAVVTDVRVIIGQTTTVNGNLRPEFYEMEEYEVTAEEFTEQTEQIMIERQESSGMLDAMGSEQFSKLGASDAAEALGKVSGASIADGKFAVIRGLADRYTTTTLNGTDLPSADPDRKAAQLDLLPTQIIERMDVAKTFSPDMSGGFAGGAIDIVTKSYPDKGMVSFSLGTSYNTKASLNKNFLASDRSSADWLAMDDGKRSLPGVARASNPSPGGSQIQNEANVERSFGSSRLSPLPERSPLNSSLGVAFGDSFKGADVKFGYLASLTYKNDYKFYDDGFVRKYDGAARTKDVADAKGVSEYTWAASTSFGLELGENHQLKYNFLYVQAAEDEARQLRGQLAGFTDEPGSYAEQNILHWTERNLTYNQLVGSHHFPDVNDISFDWAAALSTATQDEPDHRIFQFIYDPLGNGYSPLGPEIPSAPTRFWREIEENNRNLRGDLTIPLPSYNAKENSLKTGTAFSGSKRDFYQRGFEMYPLNQTANTFYNSGNPQDYLNPANYPFVQYRNYPVNITYEGEQTITAGYAMGDWAALEWLRLIGGVRWERTDLSLSGRNQTLNQALPSAGILQDDLLPSLSAVVSFTETLQLRAAWSQTVVRPTYREVAPVYIYDLADGELIGGNPRLKISDSANYDLRLEWFPRAGEIFSLSVFMKEITAPIELVNTTPDNLEYRNSNDADVYGVEAEFRKRLDNIWAPLAEFSLGGNVAFIKSEVAITGNDRLQRGFYGETSTLRPLYDQPEYVVNGDLTWEHAATGTSLTVAGGVVGRRLVLYGLSKPDEYEEPAPQLDVFLSQKLGKSWKLKFSAKNLLDPKFEVGQDMPNAGYQVRKSYTKGITYGLSLGCEF
jgi:outer membrane receptor protein involved in Fe transport